MNKPIKLETHWPKLQYTTNNSFSFFQLWRWCQLVTSDQLTGNACRHTHFAWWNDNTYASMSAALNSSTTGIYQEAGKKPENITVYIIFTTLCTVKWSRRNYTDVSTKKHIVYKSFGVSWGWTGLEHSIFKCLHSSRTSREKLTEQAA